jgi:folate-binding protein YgfZ
MTAVKIAVLPDRGVVSVTGEDARGFLDNLISNDVGLLDGQSAIFAGLLSPQGKILFDFFVVKTADGYLLDVALDQVAGLVRRLSMYKLRAKVAIAQRSDLPVAVSWGGPVGARDPRSPALGGRMIGTAFAVDADQPLDTYHAHRIELGIPEGGKDYSFGDAFPHEALFDQLHGVSFTKGCYVGQEIVARMEHRGTARKRIVRVTADAELPPAGTDILAGDVVIGVTGSHAGHRGLAMLRLDRVAEFAAKGVGLKVGGLPLVADASDVARLMPKAPDPVALS